MFLARIWTNFFEQIGGRLRTDSRPIRKFMDYNTNRQPPNVLGFRYQGRQIVMQSGDNTSGDPLGLSRQLNGSFSIEALCAVDQLLIFPSQDVR